MLRNFESGQINLMTSAPSPRALPVSTCTRCSLLALLLCNTNEPHTSPWGFRQQPLVYLKSEETWTLMEWLFVQLLTVKGSGEGGWCTWRTVRSDKTTQ